MRNSGIPDVEPILVPVENIEQPVDLGNRCTLLNHYGMQPYWHTEEEVWEFLDTALRDPATLWLCLKSRCGEFCHQFQQGYTPFFDRDPVVLTGYQGHYWAEEGKHRVCLAKRMGIRHIKAFVREVDRDYYSMLPPEGKPSEHVCCFKVVMNGSRPRVAGDILLLWLPDVSVTRRFGGRIFRLDFGADTGGERVSPVRGVECCVRVERCERRVWFLGKKREITVTALVNIRGDHEKTKIWLLRVNAGAVLQPYCREPELVTLYRYGRWRRYDEEKLTSYFPVWFPW